MSFRLKNAKGTYQRTINKMFEPLMGKIVDAYINAMVVKIKQEPEGLIDWLKKVICPL